MSVLICVQPQPGDRHWISTAWIVSFAWFSAVSLLLFVYSLLTVISHRGQFAEIAPASRWMRLWGIVVLGLQSIFYFSGIFIGRYHPVPSELAMRIWDIALHTVIDYFVSSCFTFAVLFWTLVCAATLPTRFARFPKRVQWAVLVYNVLIYIMLIANVAIAFPHSSQTWNVFEIVVPVVRDLLLSLLIVALIISLRFRPESGDSDKGKRDEVRLTVVSLLGAIGLALRGIVLLVRHFQAADRQQCELVSLLLTFFAVSTSNCLPFVAIIRFHNDFFEDERMKLSLDKLGLYDSVL
jgi:hypothetical protein